MSAVEGRDEPGGADELAAAQDALVGDRHEQTVSAEIDELRDQLVAERESRRPH